MKRDRWESDEEEEEEEEGEEGKVSDEGKARGHRRRRSRVKDGKGESVASHVDVVKGDDNDMSIGGVSQRAALTLFDKGDDEDKKEGSPQQQQQQEEEEEDDRMSKLSKHNPLLQGCRSVYDCYERIGRLDEGTYGVVWKARDTATDEIVALKQIKLFDSEFIKEGFPVTALREISVLLALTHECIVTVREMVVGTSFDKVFMVMEFMEMDLQEAMKRSGSSPFPQSELKHMLHQILSAVHHIHDKWYLHRDLKTSNILVHKSGKVALCDFGLARKYQMPLRALTQMVITLWYRPPELLFGERVYGPAVDMWSVGCIFGELLTKEAILQGRGELDQIDKIFKLLGAPTEESWPGFTSLPNARTFRWKTKDGSKLSERFPVGGAFAGGQTFLDTNGFDLLSKLLTLDPRKRITAGDALEHPYFKQGVKKQVPRFCF